MHCHAIPYQGKYIIYRPLQRLAFIGNRGMADLCLRLYDDPASPIKPEQRAAHDFLQAVSFTRPDPPFAETSPRRNAFQPTVCVLFLTNQCNLRCVYCYAHGGDHRPQTMSLELARAAIDSVCRNALESGLDDYTLSFHGGGEPVMAWRLLRDCVAYARQTELPVSINLTSNGVWTARQRAWLAENIDEISLSWDGPPKIQNWQRPKRDGRASHDAVLETARELDRRKRAYGVRVTITDDSIDYLPEIVAYLCRQTGAQTFQVEPAFDHGRARKDHRALTANDHFAHQFMAAYEIARDQGVHIYFSGSRPWLLTNRFCKAFEKALIVGPDGLVTACYEVYGHDHELAPDFIFGAMDRWGALTINSDIRYHLLECIDARRRTCRECFCYFHCAGDCPSKTFTPEPEGHLVHGRRCDLNRTITRELLVRYIEESDGVWCGQPVEEPEA